MAMTCHNGSLGPASVEKKTIMTLGFVVCVVNQRCGYAKFVSFFGTSAGSGTVEDVALPELLVRKDKNVESKVRKNNIEGGLKVKNRVNGACHKPACYSHLESVRKTTSLM